MVSNKNKLQTLSRALDVLELIEASPEPMSLTEISTALEEAPPKILRVLHTFEMRGYIRRRLLDKRYSRAGHVTGKESVLQALNIFHAVADLSPDGCFSSELNKRTGLEEEVITDLLKPLMKKGFVEQIANTERFRISPSILRIVHALLGNDSLLFLVHPLMTWLRDETGETVVLYKYFRNQHVVISSVPSLHQIRYVIDTGATYPIHLGSAGKAALSTMSEEDVDRILGQDKLAQFTDYIPEPNAIKEDLKQVRERGYALSYGERIAGASAVATPLRDAKGHVRAVISITMPADRVTPDKLNAIGVMLVKAVMTLYIPPQVF